MNCLWRAIFYLNIFFFFWNFYNTILVNKAGSKIIENDLVGGDGIRVEDKTYRAEEREGWTEAAKIDLRNYPSRSIQLRAIQHIEVQL